MSHAEIMMRRSAVKPGAAGVQAGDTPAGTIQNAQMVILARQRLAAVLDCLERLLTQPALAPVPVPGPGIVQLCTRILSVDDSFSRAGKRPFVRISGSKPHLGGKF